MHAPDVPTRTTRALLSAAGYSESEPGGADLRLHRATADAWDIHLLSHRARIWASQQFCCPLRQCVSDRIRVDAVSADPFLKEAHAEGLTTEFVGRGGRDLY